MVIAVSSDEAPFTVGPWYKESRYFMYELNANEQS
jgi:hypothetical protein